MKKIIALILMVLFVAGVAFADTSHTMAANTAPDGTTASINVGLTVEDKDFLGGVWGFATAAPTFNSTTIGDLTKEDATSVDLAIDDTAKTTNNTASPVYAYWQYRTTGGADVEITCTALSNETGTIDLTAQAVGNNAVKCTSSEKGSSIYKNTNNASDHYSQGSVQLLFSTEALTAAHIGSWTATVSMTVSAK